LLKLRFVADSIASALTIFQSLSQLRVLFTRGR
jgi:hypothetical protein